MDLLVIRATDEGDTARARAAAPPGAVWARFGDELVLAGTGAAWKRHAEALRSKALRSDRPRGVTPDRLHFVVQTGRLFQRHHPDVAVLHDRGRFLLVDLDRRRASRLRRSHPTCYGVFPLGAGEVVFARARRAARAQDPKVRRLVDAVTKQRISAEMAALAGMRTRHSTSADFRRSLARSAEILGGLGYEIRRQRVGVASEFSANLIAERTGGGPASRGLVIIAAHLDSVNWEDGPGGQAPGADDNASGGAGVLEIARVFANVPCRHDLQFILFGGEEQGLFGSKHYVAKLTARDRGRIRAVLNMDMIASTNAGERTVLLEGAAISTSMLDGLEAAAATYTGLAVERSLHASNSDHVPFIDAGLPAVLTIEGADQTNDRVHSARDTLAHVDLELAAEILRMNVAYLADAAGA